MGHTTLSQRIVTDKVLAELAEYGKPLRKEEREAFEALVAKAMKHYASISYASSYNTWALVLFSMLLEQEKERKR